MSPSRQRSDFPGGIVAGSWTTIRGANLSGVQVKINNPDAPVYYISPTQINVQAPNDISGNVSVQVIRNGAASNTMTGPVQYALGGKTYPSPVQRHFHGELRGAGGCRAVPDQLHGPARPHARRLSAHHTSRERQLADRGDHSGRVVRRRRATSATNPATRRTGGAPRTRMPELRTLPRAAPSACAVR